MAQGQAQQTIPDLAIKELQDVYVRQNFQNLTDYFSEQNQLINFNFFEINFTKPIDNFKLVHKLGFTPLDIICTQITGTGSVSFNIGLSDTTYLNISASDVCRVRFFVGKYWNLITNVTSKTSDTMTFSASNAVSSVTSKIQKIVKSATYNATISDQAIFVDCTNGPVKVFLPPVADADGEFIRVQKIDSSANILTVSSNNPGSEFIRAVFSVNYSSQWSGDTYYCVKPTWYY